MDPSVMYSYRDDNKNVTIIDIPTSISRAQGTKESPCRRQLLSSSPIEQPFAPTEPKSEKARANLKYKLQDDGVDEELVALYIEEIGDAYRHLKESKTEFDCWCLPRWTAPSIASSKRKTGDSGADESSKDVPESVHIPPNSKYILGDCNKPLEFRDAVKYHVREGAARKHFDFILLDPPWPNSSASRKGAYSIGTTLKETKKMLLKMDLDQYIAANGFMGVWITSRSTVRGLVLGPGGLFESCNVSLVEEWIWVKTTTKGEPVTALDGGWRKPYEILLLGRSPESRTSVAESSDHLKVFRRVIFAVPDLHSRKPCLKALIEPHLVENYQALEVFARYLVTGWWSWGNEVLKFNRHEHWRDIEPESRSENKSLS